MSKPRRQTATVSTAYTSPLQRELLTPEGIALRLTLAGAGERAAAFLLDVMFIVLILVAVFFAVLAAFSFQTKDVVNIVWLLSFFILRNFYFSIFEIGRRAATPGKRLLGLRVISRNGERLTANAVIARNAMRELEIFMPLGFLASGGVGGVDGLVALIGLLWSGLFLFFPLFNRDRLRAGDFIAGTWVIQIPKKHLEKDISNKSANQQNFTFTSAQLDAYGIHELQVLEGVLRKNDMKSIIAVAKRIRKKINWPRQNNESDRDFLNAYYANLRKTLEAKLLFGVRRKDKFDTR
ncbi:FIG00482940: hypothetical protein [hydrothermal vent metagenome]|uniref:RDD domain-containing protein n=1 Tax=hydrothermal vent metagenome TaxID=652676 RepID=A0A3B0S290_9ZZZZ